MERFYEGQKVIITDNTCGHFFDIGEIVTLHQVDIRGNENYQMDLYAYNVTGVSYVFDGDDCEPYFEGGNN